MMLFPHIIDLHARQRTVCQSACDRNTRFIRMNMHLHDAVVRNHYNRIADRLKELFEFPLRLFRVFLLQHNDKFRTVTEFDICFCRSLHR